MKAGGSVKSRPQTADGIANAWQDPWEDGVVMAKEIYEILGRPVTKEQYEARLKRWTLRNRKLKKKWMILRNVRESEQPKES
jgi:hypothetical protein